MKIELIENYPQDKTHFACDLKVADVVHTTGGNGGKDWVVIWTPSGNRFLCVVPDDEYILQLDGPNASKYGKLIGKLKITS